MGRLIRLLENRTALLLFGAVLLLSAAVFGAGYWATAHAEREAAVEASDRLLSVAGGLAGKTGLTEQQLAAAFAAPDPADIQRGEELLSGYGFRAGSGRGSEFFYKRSILPAAVAAAGVLCCGVLGLIAVGAVLKGVRSVTRSAEKSRTHTEPLSDRDLELLAEGVNKLVAQRAEVQSKLSGEKRYLAEYLQDLTHQIKTPAAALTLNNEIYRTHPMPHAEQLEYLERDELCIERINRLCGESLKLARLEAGAVQYKRESVSLAELVERACAPLYELAAGNGTELSSEVDEGIMLDCDALWLCEAVTNLIKNACEHTENGSVTVTATADPLAVDLYITDTGEGIEESEIPMLFRRFWSKHTEKNPTSVGIGMSIAKRITEDMGGKVYIDTAPAKGTTIRLEFLRQL